jgi:hypothetical protein
LIDELIALAKNRKNQPTLAMNPMMPSTRPTVASVPPPTVPPLEEMRCREMNPMMAAAGPSKTPRHATVQTRDRIPRMSDAMASPSVRGAA